MRSYIRQRDRLTKSASVHIQRMQKALTEMNVQLHRVVSDVTGVTGMAIIRAILAGERDPQRLALLKDPRAKRSTQEIAAALVGDYRARAFVCTPTRVEFVRYVSTASSTMRPPNRTVFI